MKQRCAGGAVAGRCNDCINRSSESDIATIRLPNEHEQLCLADSVSVRRKILEDFIRERFRQEFGAELASFLPYFLELSDAAGSPRSTAGIRQATEPLFLESYLDQPIESVLSSSINSPVERSGIVEIGNLASAGPGAASHLLIALTAFLDEAGVCWAVFTGTRTVRALFRRLEMDMVDLAPAAAGRVPNGRAAWGTYYEHEPRITASSVARSRIALLNNSRIGPSVERLWPLAAREARRFRQLATEHRSIGAAGVN